MSENDLKQPALPWKLKILLSVYSFAVDITRRSDGSVNRCLMSLIDHKVSPSEKKLSNGIKSKDIIVDPTRNLWFRLYIPSKAIPLDDINGHARLPVVFYFHGGGFAYFSPDSKRTDGFCYRLAGELSAFVISVNYRLAPEHRYPCQLDDCFDSLKFVDNNNIDGFSSYANLTNCFLAGDSAGGNLAHHVAVKASGQNFRNIEVTGNILLQPFFGGEQRTESELKLVGDPVVTIEKNDWFWKSVLPENSDRNHPAANVFGPNGVDISGVNFPPTIVVIGGFDPLKDWQEKYYEGLKQYGKEAYLVEYPNAIHAFYLFPELAESSLLIKEVKDFVQKKPCTPLASI
ncbi:hypothetical protein K2173_007170 [Erythroxylum novogranatense]|uniref:Alpha/beta hydrolase fold-3 domain-containing protein n=1 Tax=Erythroxylum novogranatense TaxID=1862640 RepID=A0AAV8SYH5_9ROSI|nr:hypothetical protein K2173_007170 [Erythroxylum novogranatense]